MSVFRVYVEKKKEFAGEARAVRGDLRTALGVDAGEVRLLCRYDLEHISGEVFRRAVTAVLSEPQVDTVYDELPAGEAGSLFAVEYLPGQYDQRADSCGQCVQLLTGGERPLVRTARVYLFENRLDGGDLERVKRYLINPVECREASLDLPDTLAAAVETPAPVASLSGFTGLDEAGLGRFLDEYGLAMDGADLAFLQRYFRDEERRDPTLTEVRMIDTYWSDHCRHTTFLTGLDEIEIEPPQVRQAYDLYLDLRRDLGEDGPVTLMDLAVIGAKALRARGLLPDLDASEEINACSVKIRIEVDRKPQDWLLMFKNETHNHPTEIEPFGGAATCLGGAIRDPLSGRAYVYQAMRVTGAADPLAPVSRTPAGKLPQRKIVAGAADGYSSYGNQIGLATGLVQEIYHPGYAAKRLEMGAVIAAAPAQNVARGRPAPGDVVLLLGGRTGRDGCGGATGSSKAHTSRSLELCGSEVQKGNPLEERKIQRLMRDPRAARLIKRCNDFGAGGVSVAVGELADGLDIDLNAVPQKYEGLDGTELAISESQERMAVVTAPGDEQAFIELARAENLTAVRVAVVTPRARLRMFWNGDKIVDISRAFLNTNGAPKRARVRVAAPSAAPDPLPEGSLQDILTRHLSDLNRCSQKGLAERFDSTIGAGTVHMPFGGKHQLTPIQAMAAKIPVLDGETSDCSFMGYGFDPYLSEQDPFRGAMLAVLESVAKVVASGGELGRCWLTFQEYFPRVKNDPNRWGLPFAALLGALKAQLGLGLAAIGGKDSMSGSFENIDVPPTLISIAAAMGSAHRAASPQFKGAGNHVYLLSPRYGEDGLPDLDSARRTLERMERLIAQGEAHSVWAVTAGGAMEGLCKMAMGNHIGFAALPGVTASELLRPRIGAFIFESQFSVADALLIGATVEDYTFTAGGETADLRAVQEAWENRLAPVYPYLAPSGGDVVEAFSYDCGRSVSPRIRTAAPRVFIPVFPGTNCEYDTQRAFLRAGAKTDCVVIRNQTPDDIEQSVEAVIKAIENCQIIALPGGFSGGDEPDGSAKFITAFFRHPRITRAVHYLLDERDGLMLGICNGFQALIKLGLLPFGRIAGIGPDSPTLAANAIGRHQSMLVRTQICANRSPWLRRCRVGDIYTVAVSHGEGRFIADSRLVRRLAENGQIATQYVDLDGWPSMDIRYNPNGSAFAIEGITSPDGRILGKMGHSERSGGGLLRNVAGLKDQHLFESAVEYFQA